jgi:uncharacterized protein
VSNSQNSPVFGFDNTDPEMQRAYERARGTFRYFWREIAWDRRRLIPTLDLACVKAPFSDSQPSGGGPTSGGRFEVEHMWISDVNFDGRRVSGVLLNSPNSLLTIQEGDAVSMPLAEISDWMYTMQDDVYGGFTIDLMRSRMGRSERAQHDAAWGLQFGTPGEVRLVPDQKPEGGFLKKLFSGGASEPPEEHPMSATMAAKLRDQISRDPGLLTAAGEQGWTLLHQEALAGNYSTVKVLLEAGADRDVRTQEGLTPLQLAHSLGWERVAGLLAQPARP